MSKNQIMIIQSKYSIFDFLTIEKNNYLKTLYRNADAEIENSINFPLFLANQLSQYTWHNENIFATDSMLAYKMPSVLSL